MSKDVGKRREEEGRNAREALQRKGVEKRGEERSLLLRFLFYVRSHELFERGGSDYADDRTSRLTRNLRKKGRTRRRDLERDVDRTILLLFPFSFSFCERGS